MQEETEIAANDAEAPRRKLAIRVNAFGTFVPAALFVAVRLGIIIADQLGTLAASGYGEYGLNGLEHLRFHLGTLWLGCCNYIAIWSVAQSCCLLGDFRSGKLAVREVVEGLCARGGVVRLMVALFVAIGIGVFSMPSFPAICEYEHNPVFLDVYNAMHALLAVGVVVLAFMQFAVACRKREISWKREIRVLILALIATPIVSAAFLLFEAVGWQMVCPAPSFDG